MFGAIDIKSIASQGQAQGGAAPSDRYRLIVSDGEHWTSAMLATQLNHLIQQGQITTFSVFKLNEFICNNVQNRK